METNEGTVDRAVRIVFGLALIYVGFARIVPTGILTYVIAVVGLIMLITGATGHCQLHTLVGMNTCKTRKSSLTLRLTRTIKLNYILREKSPSGRFNQNYKILHIIYYKINGSGGSV